MAQDNKGGPLTFSIDSAATIEQYRLVRRDSSTPTEVVYCGAGEDPLGVTEFAEPRWQGLGADERANLKIAVCPLHMLASCKVVAASAISDGDDLYTAADGKVSNAGSGPVIGTAIGAAAGDGKVLQMVPNKAGWNINPVDRAAFFDDFFAYVNADEWTLTGDAGGSAATISGSGGQLALTSDGDDNDAYSFHTTNEIVKIEANKDGYIGARVKYVEANTDDANIFFGLTSVTTADMMVDNGAGPATTFDGLGFYKVDGGTKFGIVTSNGATQDVDADQGSALVSGTWYKLEAKWTCTATTATVQFFIDGVQLGVDHTITLTGLDEVMHLSFCLKSGGANEEVLTIDWAKAVFDR